jgi:hypothetical protein
MKYRRLFESQDILSNSLKKNNDLVYWEEFKEFLETYNDEIQEWIDETNPLDEFYDEYLKTGSSAYQNYKTGEFEPFQCVAMEIFAPLLCYFDACWEEANEPNIHFFLEWLNTSEYNIYLNSVLIPNGNLFEPLCEKMCYEANIDAISNEFLGHAKNIYEGNWSLQEGYIG